jgi:sugar O-acyltransferase (sialic acid O-acetyltransferase NeuD family)
MLRSSTSALPIDILTQAPSLALPTAHNDLIIVGTGGHGREIAWVASEATIEWRLIGFLDDQASNHGQVIMGARVLGAVTDWTQYSNAAFVIAIGSPRIRRDVVRRMQVLGTPRFATVVHRSVIHSPEVRFEEGTMVMPGSVLSTNIRVGRHVIVNQSNTVGHDATIEDFCSLAPGVTLSGNVTLRQGAEIGTGASVKQGVRIGRGAMIGMGSVVTKDIGDHELALGVPARVIRTLEPF